MRTKNILKNTAFSIFLQLINVAVGFISRRIFINTLGIEYQGLNSVLTNIVSMLSVAELGIGTAIIYRLYKPLSENDTYAVTALMNFYKKVYYAIGGIVMLCGVAVSFFAQVFVSTETFSVPYIRLLFIIFTANSALSYFFSYRSSLIFADQKNYIAATVTMLSKLIGTGVYLIVLTQTENFIFSVLTDMGFIFLSNLLMYIISGKIYPYLKFKHTITPAQRGEIITDVKHLAIAKFANAAIFQTDNIIISAFLGLASVGLYSNYHLIFFGVTGFLNAFFNAMMPSLGDFMASGNVNAGEESKLEVFGAYNLLCHFVASFCAVCYFVLIPDFITLWLGKEFLLDANILWVLVLVQFMTISNQSAWSVNSVSGVFKSLQISSVLVAVINIVVSVVLVQFIGLLGVFIGTASCHIVSVIMQGFITYKKVFKSKGILRYFLNLLTSLCLTVILCVSVNYLVSLFTINHLLFTFILKAILCVIIVNAVNLLIYHRTENFIFIKRHVYMALGLTKE